MKKKFLSLLTIILLFTFTGCTKTFGGIKKDVLMKDNIKSNLNKSENFKETKTISEGQVKNIFTEGLKKYYGLDLKKDINKERVYVDFTNKENIMGNMLKTGVGDYLKVLLDEGVDIPERGVYTVDTFLPNINIVCMGTIDAQNGDILSLRYYLLYKKYKESKMNDDEAKKIAEKFIRDNNISNINELKFNFLNNRISEIILFYNDKKNKNIKVSINIDTMSKKVIGFSTDIEAYIKSSYLKDSLNEK